jgi:hypothetical protein
MYRRNGMSKIRFKFYDKDFHKEAELNRSLTDEAIEKFGNRCYFLPRTQPNEDLIFGEDNTSTFDSATELILLLDGVDTWNSGNDLFSKFGITADHTITAFIEMRRFERMVAERTQPVEKDFIYIKIMNKWFEVKYVNDREEWYESGQLYAYKMELKLLQYSHEPISTGVQDVDNNLPSNSTVIEDENTTVDEFDTENNVIENFDDILNGEL